MKIKEIFGHGKTPADAKEFGPFISGTNIGIEHELEGVTTVRNPKGWRAESDGSLRSGGIEYVFDGPKAGRDAEKAILALRKELPDKSYRINERTSTHVHIDFNEATPKQVGRFILIYCMLEDVLFQLCDDSRKDNPYCVPIRNSHIAMQAVHAMLSRSSISGEIFGESYRYSALNMASLRTFGTLEVRMRETVIDPDELIFWINIFLAIKQYALAWRDGSPGTIFKTLSGDGVDSVMSDILSPVIWEEIIRRVPDAESLVYEGIRDLLGTVIRPTLTDKDLRIISERDDLLSVAREEVDGERDDRWLDESSLSAAREAVDSVVIPDVHAELLGTRASPTVDASVADPSGSVTRYADMLVTDFGSRVRSGLMIPDHTLVNNNVRIPVRATALSAYNSITGEHLVPGQRSTSEVFHILQVLCGNPIINQVYRDHGRSPALSDLMSSPALNQMARLM